MIGALLLLLITGLVGVARAAADRREITPGSVIGEPFGAGNNLFLPVAGLSTTVPAEIPYLHGHSYLQIFVLPVPRALWPTKPADDITTVITRFDPGNSGFAFPAFGEGYANFGLLGVALCGVLLGGGAELLDRRFAGSQDLKSSVVAAVQAGVFLQLFSRGSFAPQFTTYIGILAAAGYSKLVRKMIGNWRTVAAQARLGTISACHEAITPARGARALPSACRKSLNKGRRGSCHLSFCGCTRRRPGGARWFSRCITNW